MFFCHIHLKDVRYNAVISVTGYARKWGGGHRGIGALRLQEELGQQMFEIDSDWLSHPSKTALDSSFLKPNSALRRTPVIHVLHKWQ